MEKRETISPGQRFGRLTALKEIGTRKNGAAVWFCRCDCGNLITESARMLQQNQVDSCGCLAQERLEKKSKDLAGQQFGRLTALRPTEERRSGSIVWECKCLCGNTVWVTQTALSRGTKLSCGCLRKTPMRTAEQAYNTYNIGKSSRKPEENAGFAGCFHEAEGKNRNNRNPTRSNYGKQSLRRMPMCTAITLKTLDFYFGRTLDHTCSYGETVTVTPRKVPLPFRHGKTLDEHYAIIGMAYVLEEYPLYYDAVNEKGLAIAGLNFVGNTHYRGPEEGKDNVAQFELIPWLLGRCASVKEARQALERLCITPTAFRPELPPSQLHWLIADRQEAIVLESMADGLHIYDNPVGVLTNNPPFDRQLFRLNDYRALSPRLPENCFAPGLELKAYSFGMGTLGLPGDLTSTSRFVRAAFTRLHSVTEETEQASVSQFFHIMGTVSQTRGCCDTGEGGLEFTQYTSCCNADKGIYYYTTYENHQITAVDLHREALDGDKLVSYPLVRQEQVRMMN